MSGGFARRPISEAVAGTLSERAQQSPAELPIGLRIAKLEQRADAMVERRNLETRNLLAFKAMLFAMALELRVDPDALVRRMIVIRDEGFRDSADITRPRAEVTSLIAEVHHMREEYAQLVAKTGAPT